MRGIVTLYDRAGEYVQERIFRDQGELNEIIRKWKKLYAKGFENCNTKVEYNASSRNATQKSEAEQPIVPQQSRFKKGAMVKSYRIRKTNRSNFPNMDGH